MLDFGILHLRLGTYSPCDLKDPRNDLSFWKPICKMGSEAYTLSGHIYHLLLVSFPITHKDRAKIRLSVGQGQGSVLTMTVWP